MSFMEIKELLRLMVSPVKQNLIVVNLIRWVVVKTFLENAVAQEAATMVSENAN